MKLSCSPDDELDELAYLISGGPIVDEVWNRFGLFHFLMLIWWLFEGVLFGYVEGEPMQLNMVGPYIIEPNHCLGLSLLHFILIGLQELKLFLQALGADASGRLVVGVKGLFLFINHYDILNYLSELVLKILIKMKICVFVVCLLGLTGTLDLSPEEDKHNTVIESNHYFSDYQLGTTYNINKVRKDRPIIYFLKKKNS